MTPVACINFALKMRIRKIAHPAGKHGGDRLRPPRARLFWDSRWIEADLEIRRVITVNAPALNITWFLAPMKIVRWRMLH
jgi:hypothetical protein